MKIKSLFIFTALLSFTSIGYTQPKPSVAEPPQYLIAVQQGDYHKAFNLALPLAEQGDKSAQATVASLYLDGIGGERDVEKAKFWYEKAEKTTDSKLKAQVQVRLFSIYFDSNPKKALKALQSAANLGNAEAQYLLGVGYVEGRYFKQNYPKAFQLFKTSATQGYARAQIALGTMYWYGSGVAVNKKEAKRLLALGCQDPEAQNQKACHQLQ